MLLLVILLPLLIGTTLTVWSGALKSGAYRQRTAWIAATVTGISLWLLLMQAPAVIKAQAVHQWIPWVPEIGLNIGFRLDGLSLLFALLITGMGLLIIAYAHHYLSASDPVGKFYGTLMLFMAAMLGIVLSDNLLLLLVFWELTSIASFLLVGYWSHRADARAGARMALAVTGAGGLAMLAGFILLGQIAGTYEINLMPAMAAQIQADSRYPAALVLILLGCFTKSAQFPFHFWLPQAMAAPTPVSAYLHSATMVKAGIFVLARLFSTIGGTELFSGLVLSIGLATMALGAFMAIFKHDLKGLLAYSTISHLGLITFLIGLGSPLAAVAAMLHILNHASFKAALFMVAGIVDHETGTRDLRQLGGLYPLMPWTATFAMVASAGMAGVPLFNGFISKEMFLAQTLDFAREGGWRWIIPALATTAAACSVAYAARFIHDLFFHGAPGALPRLPSSHASPFAMKAPVALLAMVCLAAGIAPAAILGPLVQAASSAMLGHAPPPYHLAIWHGFNAPLALSTAALAAGAALYFVLARGRQLHRLQSEAWLGTLNASHLFTRATDGLFHWAGRVTAVLETASLQRYVACMVVACIAVVAVPLLSYPSIGTGNRALLPASALAWILWALLLGACAWLVLRHHDRFQSVIVVGVVGLVSALCFVGLSAPDLALTQLAVEVVSTVLLLMGLALLPRQSPRESSRSRRLRDGFMALVTGTGMAWLAWVMLTRDHDSIAWYFLNHSATAAGGTNVVNVILVDFRGYDTFGEITVLGIAAIGVLALMDGMRTRRALTDTVGQPWTFETPPLMLRTAARTVLPLAMVVALYIFLRGHNMPGGGFIAGLMTAVALVLQYIALGQTRTEALLHAQAGQRFVRWIAAGLGIAGLTGLGAFIFDQPFLTSAHGHMQIPLLGALPLASAAWFDLGVYLTVVGATMLTLSTLGAVSRDSATMQASTGSAPP